MSLGKKLAALRKSSNLTQEALGKQLDMSAQAVSKWENDLSEPDMATLKKLAAIYNVPIAEFFDAKDAENINQIDDTVTAYKVILTDYIPSDKLLLIKHIRELYGLSLSDAKNISESLPYTMEYATSQDNAQKIKEALEDSNRFTVKIEEAVLSKTTSLGLCTECGKIVTVDNIGNTAGKILCKSCKNTKEAVAVTKKEINRDALKSMFRISNIFAAIPAIAWLILAFCNLGSTFLVILESIAIGILGAYVLFSTVFQLFYKTAVRFIITLPMRTAKAFMSESDGCITLIISLALYLVAIIASVFTVVAGLCVAPFTYPFSLKKRIANLKSINENEADDILDIID